MKIYLYQTSDKSNPASYNLYDRYIQQIARSTSFLPALRSSIMLLLFVLIMVYWRNILMGSVHAGLCWQCAAAQGNIVSRISWRR